jgi:HlyD family secretion protein
MTEVRRKKRRTRWIVAVVALIALAGGGWAYVQRHKQDRAPAWQTAVVTRGDLVQTITASGTLNPVTNVQVGSQISGIIQKIYVDFNSPVKAGQVVAQLDPATYQANVLSAEGELANAKANLELAQINARRAEELFKNHLISQADYDQAMATLRQAEAQVKIRAAALERAKVDLSRCTIYSPVDGIVISRNVDVGQTVAASLSAPVLFLIANDLSQMQINANVAEADIGGVEVGQPVEFTVDAYPLQTFTGRVVQVRNAPITVQNVVTYDTVIAVHNPDLKLKPGMTANVTIITAKRENVLKVPNAALRFRPPETAAEIRTNAAPERLTAATVPGGERMERDRGPRGERRRGDGAGPPRAPGGMRPKGERHAVRTVYVLETNSPPGTTPPLRAVQIKCGISDAVATEVLEGLKEGDVVVTGVQMPGAVAQNQPTSPFGAFMRRRGF